MKDVKKLRNNLKGLDMMLNDVHSYDNIARVRQINIVMEDLIKLQRKLIMVS